MKKVYLDTSTIPHAGIGLFTKEKILKNERITDCQGQMINRKEALGLMRQGKDTHCKSLNFHVVIDGYKSWEETRKDGSGLASFANDGLTKEKNNTKFGTDYLQTTVFLKALRDIEPGEEIFVSYGRAYWKRHGSRLHIFHSLHGLHNVNEPSRIHDT